MRASQPLIRPINRPRVRNSSAQLIGYVKGYWDSVPVRSPTGEPLSGKCTFVVVVVVVAWLWRILSLLKTLIDKLKPLEQPYLSVVRSSVSRITGSVKRFQFHSLTMTLVP